MILHACSSTADASRHPSPIGILVFLWFCLLLFPFFLSIAGRTGHNFRGNSIPHWIVCPEIAYPGLQSMLSGEFVQIWRLPWCQTSCKHAYCTCSSQQHKGSLQVVCSYTPGLLQDCWHLYLVYTVQQHCKGVGRLTFCLETVARWSMFFWRLSNVLTIPLALSWRHFTWPCSTQVGL